jgi:integrase
MRVTFLPTRSHYLPLIDMARLWTAAGHLREPVWRDLVQFLIAVPCRRGEARRLDWAHLKVAAGEWHQLGSMTKNRDPHRLFLHALALKILESRQLAHAKALAGGDMNKAARILAAGPPRAGLVFPAPMSGGPVDTFTDIKAALVRASKPERSFEEDDELTGWTWHDFRRSFATALGEAGIPEAVADAILNHRQSATRGGVLGVYQRASRWPEQVKAMELWGRLLQSALDGSEAGAKVITMTRTG